MSPHEGQIPHYYNRDQFWTQNRYFWPMSQILYPFLTHVREKNAADMDADMVADMLFDPCPQKVRDMQKVKMNKLLFYFF